MAGRVGGGEGEGEGKGRGKEDGVPAMTWQLISN